MALQPIEDNRLIEVKKLPSPLTLLASGRKSYNLGCLDYLALEEGRQSFALGQAVYVCTYGSS
jgi:hypothetical protein